MDDLVVSLFMEEDVHSPALVFCRTRKLAETAAEKLAAAKPGLRVTYAHAKLPTKKLKEHLEGLRASKLDVVCCTDVWSTGVNIPYLGAVVLACGGSAPIGLLQRIGRGLRSPEGKDSCQIWDLVAWGDTRQAARAEVLTGQGVGGKRRGKPRVKRGRQRQEDEPLEQTQEEYDQQTLEFEAELRKTAAWDFAASAAGFCFGLVLLGLLFWLLEVSFATLKRL